MVVSDRLPIVLERESGSLRGRQLVFGIDGMDRSQGLLEKLRAFAEALARYPDLQERITLAQVAVPLRQGLPRHAALRRETERLVGEINGRFGRPGWVPVHYLHRVQRPADPALDLRSQGLPCTPSADRL